MGPSSAGEQIPPAKGAGPEPRLGHYIAMEGHLGIGRVTGLNLPKFLTPNAGMSKALEPDSESSLGESMRTLLPD